MNDCKPGCEQQTSACPNAQVVADAAVKKVFAILGVDIDEPKDVAEFQDDLRFGRKLRRNTDRGIVAVWVIVATGMASALWAGITGQIRH